jgi:hypothetical protein
LGVIIRTTGAQSLGGFEIRQLRADEIYSEGRYLTAQAFAQQATATCS